MLLHLTVPSRRAVTEVFVAILLPSCQLVIGFSVDIRVFVIGLSHMLAFVSNNIFLGKSAFLDPPRIEELSPFLFAVTFNEFCVTVPCILRSYLFEDGSRRGAGISQLICYTPSF